MDQTLVPLFSARIANAGLDLVAPLKRVVERNWFVLGDEVSGFESEFAAYVQAKSCISVANGSDALEIGLRALGVGPGKKVAVVANAGFYSSTAVYAAGAEPVYVEVDPRTLTMDPAALAAALRQGLSAVIVTHLYGQLAAIEELAALARDARVPLIEDCAQSHGARRNGRMAGSYGTLACFSFYPTKNLGAIGDGGAIITNDAEIDTRVRRLRQYGWSGKYHVAERGGRNSRLDELQAAVLRIKLPHLDSWNEQRRAIAQRYNDAFARFDMQLPCSTGNDYVAHLYVIRLAQRDSFVAAMRAAQIATDVHYPVPDHLQQAYATSAGVRALPVTEMACRSVVSLPCFPGLERQDVDRVIAAVSGYFQART